MCDQFIAMIDANHRAYVLFVHAGRWFGVRLDFAAASCVAVAALLVVLLRHSLSSGLAGTLLIFICTFEDSRVQYICLKLLILCRWGQDSNFVVRIF